MGKVKEYFILDQSSKMKEHREALAKKHPKALINVVEKSIYNELIDLLKFIEYDRNLNERPHILCRQKLMELGEHEKFTAKTKPNLVSATQYHNLKYKFDMVCKQLSKECMCPTETMIETGGYEDVECEACTILRKVGYNE